MRSFRNFSGAQQIKQLGSEATKQLCHPELVSGSELEATRARFRNKFGMTINAVTGLPSKQCKVAFTLAEVLITLTIIGVVAAIVMPSLITKYQKQQTVTKLKKIYSTMTQSIELSKIDNGNIEDWNWTLPHNEFFKKYLCTNCKILKDCQNQPGCWNPAGTLSLARDISFNDDTKTNLYKMILADGTALCFDGENDNSHIHITVDINGIKEPNTYGKDTFEMTLTKGAFSDYTHKINKAGLYMFGHGLSVDELKGGNMYSCAKDKYGVTCGEKILFDNWQIKDDYPW